MERNSNLPRDAAAAGILLYVEADRLKARAAEGAVTDVWKAKIGSAKEDLLQILTAAPPPTADGAATEAIFAASEGFWRTYLGDAPPTDVLPLDRPRTDASGALDGWLPWRCRIDADAVRARAAVAGVSVPRLALALLGLLAARWSGQREAVIGVSACALLAPEPPSAWDCMIDNVLPIRCRHDADRGLDDWLRDGTASIDAALAHRALPLAQLRAKFENESVAQRLALFRVGLVVADGEVSTANTTGASDLELVFPIGAEDALGGWRYDSAILDAGTVERIAESYDTLLAALCGVNNDDVHIPSLPGFEGHATPSSPAALPLLGRSDRIRMVGWSAAGEPPVFAGGVHALVVEQARRTPDAPALVCGGMRIDYRELDRRSDRVASRLLAAGAAPAEPIGICVGRSADWVVAALGALKAGCAYLALDPGHPDDRLRHMIEDSGTRIVATHAATAARVESWGACPIPLDTDVPDAGNPVAHCAEVEPGQMAYMVYTSGSTGVPKAVMLSHAGLSNLQRAQQTWFGMGSGDRVLQFASISFDAATWEWIYALANGAALVVCTDEQRASPDALAACLIDERISHALVPPAMLAHMDPELPYELRCLMVAGEALEPALGWRWARRFPMFNAYGPSETTVAASIARVVPNARISIGRAIENFTLHVVDDRLQPVPPGVPGELVVAGIGVGIGYRNRPELEAEKFLGDLRDPARRAYRTGDLVRMGLDGELEFLGRIDDQVKIRGYRVELGEVTHRIACVPGVREAHAVVRGGVGERRLIAYVCPDAWPVQGGERAFAQRIRAALETQLPDYMLPAGYVFLSEFPLNVNGKIDRARLPAPDHAVSAADDFVGPRDQREAALCRIWLDVLKAERVGVHDRFFAIGGDSILLIQAVARANRDGLRMTARDMYEHQTVAALAVALASRAPVVIDDAPVEESGDIVLSPVQRDFLAGGEALQHFNQAILLDAANNVDVAFLRAAMRALLEHHPALRLRFEHTVDGWRGFHAAIEDFNDDECVVVEALPDDAVWNERAVAICERHQASMDPSGGPAFRMVLFTGGAVSKLLLLAHHLVVDGVSWRLLLEDLQILFDQWRAGQPALLSSPIASFASWMRRVDAHVARGGFDAERAYWREAYAQADVRLPVDREPPASLRHGDDASIDTEIDAARTADLMQVGARSYRCGVQELLLAAVATALCEWTGRDRQWITLETHGRDPLPGGADPGRAVGWFTATYPLALPLSDCAPGVAVRAAKEALRCVPGNGLGHGWLAGDRSDAELAESMVRLRPQVLFNYLGRFDTPRDGAGHGAFGFSRESAGRTVGAAMRRNYLLGINAIVSDGLCRISLDYSAAAHDPGTMRGFMDRVLVALDQIIAHCRDAAPTWTPSDFPSARVDASQLDVWQSRHEIRDLYPATPMQKGMMFHTLMRADAYVTQLWPMLEGDLDPVAMRAAWQTLIDRHDVFRTIFVGEIDRLHQLVEAHASLDWREEDWRGLSLSERTQAFDRYREADRATGFDMTRASLQRITLIRMEDRRWWMLWTHQHMLVDGWSLPLVFGELMKTYASLVMGRPETMPPAPRYGDYVDWLSRQDRAQALDYWEQRLAGTVLPTPIVRAGAKPEGMPQRTRRTDWALDATDTARLLAFAQANALTPFSLVQLAWAWILAARSGLRDVVYGATVSGRPADVPSVESMVGLFINSLPVRATLDPRESVATAAHTLQAAFQRDDLNGHVSLGDIQKRCLGGRQGQLFDSLLVFENYPLESVEAPVDDTIPRLVGAGDQQQTEFAVTVSAMLSDRMYLRMVSRSASIPENEAIMLEQAFGDVLRALPEVACLSELDRFVPGAGETDEADVVARIEHVAAHSPEAVAAECEGYSLRYGELVAQSNRAAAYLQAHGVGPGATVGVLTHACPEMLPVFVGIMKIGAAYLPLDPTYPQERLRAMLEVGRPAMLLAAPPLVVQAAGTGIPTHSIMDAIARPATVEGAPVESRVDPLGAAYVIFTSGSTGRPKGVQIAHASLARLVARMQDLLEMTPSDRVLQFAPISFDVSVQEIFTTLISGARLVFLAPAMPKLGHGLIAYLREQAISVATLPPSVLVSSKPDDLPALRLVISGAEPLSSRVVDTWAAGRRFCNQYGPTEATVTSTARYCGGDMPPNIGWPISGVSTYIVGEGDRPLANGATGELLIGGDGVALGYLNDPAATADRFRPDPFSSRSGARLYRTGDLARRQDDGTYEFAGRNDDQVKLRGYRIELADVEAALLRHSAVIHAIAVVIGAGEDDRRLVAYVQTPDPAKAGLVETLRRHMADTVASYMCPSAIVPMAAFPVGVNGKVDKSRLPEPFEFAANNAGQPDPEGGNTAIVAAIFAEVIGVPSVGSDANFFDAGGDSLLAVKAATRISERFGIEVNVATLLEAPSARLLAARLPAGAEREIADRLLRDIEAMSEEEVLRMLQSDVEFSHSDKESVGI